MDLSNLADAVGSNLAGDQGFTLITNLLTGLKKTDEGFELLRMTDEEEAPMYITENGFNNPDLYGVRNLEVVDNKLMLGSASMSNLSPNGGWHVHSISDPNIPESISPTAIKKPGIILERNAEYVNLATVGGENITTVTVYDAAGRKISSAHPDSHIVSIPLQNEKGLAVIKVVSEKGEWVAKLN